MKNKSEFIVHKELLRKIKDDDFSAFRKLYEATYSFLFAYTKKYIADDEAAKDILQEMYISLWENRKSITLRNPAAYFYKNIKNRCLNYIKHQKVIYAHKDVAYLELKEIELSAPEKFNTTFHYLSNEELKVRINKILDNLPDDRRKIFEMSRFQGLKNHEIAEQLNLSVRTVDTQIYRSMKVFKDQLRDLL